MKRYFSILLLMLLGCQNNSKQNSDNTFSSRQDDTSIESSEKKSIKSSKRVLDSVGQCESTNFISLLLEIPNRDSNAFILIITSKNDGKKTAKILNTRPGMSHIDYCNDLYTVVWFPCGGPCFSEVFVFTNKNRRMEQYDNPQEIKNNPNIITYFKNDEFENLIVHNFLNNKEQTVDICDNNNWGHMDSMFICKDRLFLYYEAKNEKYTRKSVDLKPIL